MENNSNAPLPEDLAELEALSQTYFNLFNSTLDKKYLEKFSEIQVRMAQIKIGASVPSTPKPDDTPKPDNTPKSVDPSMIAVLKNVISIFGDALDDYKKVVGRILRLSQYQKEQDRLESRLIQLKSVVAEGAVTDSSFQYPDTAEVVATLETLGTLYVKLYRIAKNTGSLTKLKEYETKINTYKKRIDQIKQTGIEGLSASSDSMTSDSTSFSSTNGETNSSGSSGKVTRPELTPEEIQKLREEHAKNHGRFSGTRPTTQQVVREDVTQQTGFETIVVPFEFIGNKNAEVKKVTQGHGDGDTGKAAIAIIQATLQREIIKIPDTTSSHERRGGSRQRNLNVIQGRGPSKSREEYLAKRIRYYVDLTYRVVEPSYSGKAGKEDNLELTGRVWIDVTDRFPVHNTENRTESWDITPLNPEDFNQRALYTDYRSEIDWQLWGNPNYIKNNLWYPFEYSKCNRETKVGSQTLQRNNPVDWLWIEKFKIFGPQNELGHEGQIGVKGTITLKLKAVKTITTKYVEDMNFSVIGFNARQGSGMVLNMASEPEAVHQVLGNGYLMDQEYARTTSLSTSPVLNIERLNADRHLVKKVANGRNQHKWSAEGSDEYTRQVSEDLKVEVKGSLFGASFSNATKTSNTSEQKEKKSFKLESAYWVFQDYVYTIDETDPAYLNAYLESNFKDDINNTLIAYQGKPQWDNKVDAFIRKYGTHVITGMVTGGRVDMNMSYAQRTTNSSESKTFSNVSSICYNPITAKLNNKNENGSQGGSPAGTQNLDDDILIALSRGASSAEEAKKLIDKIRQAGGQKKPSGSPQGGGNKEDGISISVMYELKETIERITNEKLEDFNLVMRGGNLMVNPFTDDNTSFDKWRNTFNSQNTVWCDYVPGFIVPIFKFAPDYNSYEVLYKAWSDYCIRHHISCVPLGRGYTIEPITISGSKDNVSHYPNSKDSYAISTNDRWPTGWRLTMDLINIAETKTMALAVRFQVTLGKESDNNEPPARLKESFDFKATNVTNLILVDVNEFTSSALQNTVVDTSLVDPHFEAKGVIYGDWGYDPSRPEGWIDITKEIREAINSTLSDGRRCLIDLSDSNSKVEIHVEGATKDDREAMIVRFNLYLPYLKFNG